MNVLTIAEVAAKVKLTRAPSTRGFRAGTSRARWPWATGAACGRRTRSTLGLRLAASIVRPLVPVKALARAVWRLSAARRQGERCRESCARPLAVRTGRKRSRADARRAVVSRQ